jgi:hypothetical protein
MKQCVSITAPHALEFSATAPQKEVERMKGIALGLLAMVVSLTAHAQLKSVDHGAAAIDSNGLEWANTVGINLGWSASPIHPDTAQTWIAALNASDYDGHNDWTLPTADFSAPNTTTNQLGELFYTDCGNTPDTQTSLSTPGKKSCGRALPAVSNAIDIGTNGFQGDVNFSSGMSLGLVPGEGYWSWSIYRASDSTEGYWDSDTNNAGIVGAGDTLAVREAPEIDPVSAAGGFTLLLGFMLVLRGRRERILL